MDVVTCYRASKLAGVSKQLIGNMKKANADNKGKYPFFAFDRDSGSFGVDTEHPSWKEYIQKRRSMGLLDPPPGNGQLKATPNRSNSNTIGQDEAFRKLATAYLQAVDDIFGPDASTMAEFKATVRRYFTGG